MTPPPAAEVQEWTKVLTPERRLLAIDWAELWRYRDLVRLFVTRDLIATYKQTILGPLWFLAQPLLTTIVFTVIFGHVARTSTDDLPPFLFFNIGVVAWSYFAECLSKTSRTFSANAGVFGKVYFPRLTVPVSIVIGNLLTFAVQFALFLVLLAWHMWMGAPIHPNWRIVILPLLLLQMGALGIGAGCLVSSVTTRYKDLAMLVGFGTQLWMYASSVVIPLSDIPEKWRWLFILNPMVPIIESFRFAFLGSGVIEVWQLAVSFVVSVAILFGGLIMFHRVESTFTDTI